MALVENRAVPVADALHLQGEPEPRVVASTAHSGCRTAGPSSLACDCTKALFVSCRCHSTAGQVQPALRADARASAG